MNTQTAIDNKFAKLLDFLNYSQKTCAHLHDAWCSAEFCGDNHPEYEYIATLNNPELLNKIQAIDDLLDSIHESASAAAHQLESMIEAASTSIGYEFKELGGEIHKKH